MSSRVPARRDEGPAVPFPPERVWYLEFLSYNSHVLSDLHRQFQEAPLYAILDTALRPALDPPEILEALLRGGVRVVQYRHKAAFRRANFDACCAMAQRVHQAGGAFIVNDRPDVAVLCGADGVHLGQDDLPPEKARAFFDAAGSAAGAARLIGYSTHNRAQAAEAACSTADYVAVGPIFPTSTKRHPDPVVGTAFVTETRSLTAKPLVAIGGITLENAASVIKAGADAVAVISDLMLTDDIASRARQFLAVLKAARG